MPVVLGFLIAQGPQNQLVCGTQPSVVSKLEPDSGSSAETPDCVLSSHAGWGGRSGGWGSAMASHSPMPAQRFCEVGAVRLPTFTQ